MAVEYIARVAKMRLSPRDKFVLVALANYADDEGKAWPKQSTLAEWTGYSRDTINKCLRDLEEDGLIKSESRTYKDGRRASKVYRLIVNEQPMSAAPTRPDLHGDATNVGEPDTVHVGPTDTVHADETDNNTRQPLPVNIDPSITPPTPPSPFEGKPRGELIQGLSDRNAIDTLRRTAPTVHAAFEDLARLQRTSFPAKVAQAKSLLERIDERGETAVTESLKTILATAGDGGQLFTRAMAHLGKRKTFTAVDPILAQYTERGL